MGKYTLEIFDSRNTSYKTPLHHSSTRLDALRIARSKSLENGIYKVIIHSIKDRAWVEYTKGNKLSWSLLSI